MTEEIFSKSRGEIAFLDKKLGEITLKEFLSVGYAGFTFGRYRPGPDDDGPWPWGPIGYDPSPTPWILRMVSQNTLLKYQMDHLQEEIDNLKKRR